MDDAIRHALPQAALLARSGPDGRVAATAVLPARDGDPVPRNRDLPTAESPDEDVLRCAEILAIPWKRVLLEEIAAEEKLRRYFRDVDEEGPLESSFAVLGLDALRSWRVRNRVERLAYAARAGVRGALRSVRAFARHLAGEAGPEPAALAWHCRFAYERILLLQRARRAAARSRGTTAERLAFVCSTARCSFEDAAWALREEDAPRRGHRLDAAIRKVREEGFLVPRARNEARSLFELRRMVSSLAFPRGVGAAARRVRRVSSASVR